MVLACPIYVPLIDTHQDQQQELSRVIADLEQIEMSVDPGRISRCFAYLARQDRRT
jgi:hypothetical protein